EAVQPIEPETVRRPVTASRPSRKRRRGPRPACRLGGDGRRDELHASGAVQYIGNNTRARGISSSRAMRADDLGCVAIEIGESLNVALGMCCRHARKATAFPERSMPAAHQSARLFAIGREAQLLGPRARPLDAGVVAVNPNGEVVVV